MRDLGQNHLDRTLTVIERTSASGLAEMSREKRKMKRTFSVIIATCNRQELVFQAIDSVLEQTFKDYEIIVVDDGSSAEIKDKIKTNYGKAIRLVESNMQGSARAYQHGVSVATGRYVAFLDDDDLYLPWTLATYHRIIQDLSSPPVVLGSLSYKWDDNRDISTSHSPGEIHVRKFKDFLAKDVTTGTMSQSRIVMQKAVFDDLHREKQEEPFILNDYHLVLLAGVCGPCVIVKSPTTALYRQHPTQATKNVEKMSRGILQLVEYLRGSASRSRRLDRYAYLGGPVKEWFRKAVDAQHPELAIKLLVNGWPMMAAATARKLLVQFRRPTNLQILSMEKRHSKVDL